MTAFEYETPGNAFRYPSSAVCLLTLENGVSTVWDGDWSRQQSADLMGGSLGIHRVGGKNALGGARKTKR